MHICALVGKSGTGKSHKAQLVARENKLNFIIDDGLLIHGNRVLAGASAKREKTPLSAVRRAIFQDPDHAKEVKEKIVEHNVDRLLILGTSVSMIEVICEKLSLPFPERIIYIDDISTKAEIDKARKSRTIDGKHVIPVPTLEIKKDFSGFLLDSLKIFYRRGKDRPSRIVDEKTVVRPTYSYMGKYTIHDTTIHQIALHAAQQVPGVGKCGKVYISNNTTGINIKLDLVVEYGLSLPSILSKVQKEVAKTVEHMTSINVLKVDVTAKKLYFK